MTGLRYVSYNFINGHSFYLRIRKPLTPETAVRFYINLSPVSLFYGGLLHMILLLNVVAHSVSRPVWTSGLSPRNIN